MTEILSGVTVTASIALAMISGQSSAWAPDGRPQIGPLLAQATGAFGRSSGRTGKGAQHAPPIHCQWINGQRFCGSPGYTGPQTPVGPAFQNTPDPPDENPQQTQSSQFCIEEVSVDLSPPPSNCSLSGPNVLICQADDGRKFTLGVNKTSFCTLKETVVNGNTFQTGTIGTGGGAPQEQGVPGWDKWYDQVIAKFTFIHQKHLFAKFGRLPYTMRATFWYRVFPDGNFEHLESDEANYGKFVRQFRRPTEPLDYSGNDQSHGGQWYTEAGRWFGSFLFDENGRQVLGQNGRPVSTSFPPFPAGSRRKEVVRSVTFRLNANKSTDPFNNPTHRIELSGPPQEP